MNVAEQLTQDNLTDMADRLTALEQQREQARNHRSRTLLAAESKPDQKGLQKAFQKADTAYKSLVEQCDRLGDAIDMCTTELSRAQAKANREAFEQRNERLEERGKSMVADAKQLEALFDQIVPLWQRLIDAGRELERDGARVFDHFGYRPFHHADLTAAIRSEAMARAPSVFGELSWDFTRRRKPLADLIDQTRAHYLHKGQP